MKTLIFIDDETAILDVCEKFYTKQGYRVLTAPSGKAGLKLLGKAKPDLVLLDIRMPGLDGIETLKRLRKKNTQAKVIMLTGYGTADSIRETSNLGISDFISKPFDMNELLQIIRETLGETDGG